MNQAVAHTRREVTAAMAEMVVSLDAQHLPDETVDLITRAFVDSLGCGLAGTVQPEGTIMRGWVVSQGGAPDSTLIGGGGTRVPAAWAALANGTTMHALDYDDFALKRMMHPSVVLAPAVLALAERDGATGMEVVLAYAAGYEAAARVSRRINPEHYARGWHSTSTIGGLGAAAASARMLGLDAAGVATTVAIAASSAAGLRDNFGTMVKPLHAGNAAFHGVVAAELAVRGFSASGSILDGDRSYPEVYRNDDSAVITADDFALDALELVESGISFKRYTCCGAIHAALDAALELASEHRLTPDRIARVRCAVHPRAPEILIHHVATTPEQGRFCVEYSLAVALTDGHAGVPQYTEERIADPAVQDLSSRIEVYADPALAEGEGSATALSNSAVSIETTDGATYKHRVQPHRPMSWDELERKFRSSAAIALDPDGVDGAFDLARRLSELDDAGQLTRAFSGAPAGTIAR
jgi:2-methylcitrate dehydratase PrpD